MKNENAMNLLEKIKAHSATVGVIGLGYVGLPLAIEFSRKGFPVIGFDTNEIKVKKIAAGESYIKHIPPASVQELSRRKDFRTTTDFSLLKKTDCIIICVPTPLTKNRDPEMLYIKTTSEAIVDNLHKGQLIVLESTTYPGTTREVVKPILEESGLTAGKDFFLAYSPEREDPGNPKHSLGTIPKVVGGLTDDCLILAETLYSQVAKIIPVTTPEVAEATKLMENIFRAVNIALVNELKIIFDRMGINVWEVIEAASSKPFGYMPFYPGPGLGGHCIPIDPFYLTWRAREFGIHTRFIELAGEINTKMPEYVIQHLAAALNDDKKSLKGSIILILGAAYKRDVDDIRESPSLELIEILHRTGAKVEYHDPFIPYISDTGPGKTRMESVPLSAATLSSYDAVLIVTDHSNVDYKLIGDHASLVVDTRNAMSRVHNPKARIVKA